MNNLGIHQFLVNPNQCYYFVERKFGNYLVFNDFMQSFDVDFLKSKGGVYKQFLESITHVNHHHGNLFNKFGASAVADFRQESFHEKLPLERFSIDYVDPELNYFSSGLAKSILIEQRGCQVLILGSSYYINEKNMVFKDNQEITDSFFESIKEKKINFVLFTRFEKESFLQVYTKSWLQKIYDLL